jgi:polygalacturonase/phosphodiesterase/alkaline phosphatase D-like protein
VLRKLTLLNVLSLILTGLLFVSAVQADSVVLYDDIPGATACPNYQVSVNGQTVFVEAYKGISYARFSFSGTANVTITVPTSVTKHTIAPSAFDIEGLVSGPSVSFSLSESKKLVIDVNDYGKLFLFADPLEQNAPSLGDSDVVNIMDYGVDNTGATLCTTQIQQALDDVSAMTGGGVLYFPDGKYLTGTIVIGSNTTVYLEDGAVIQGTPNISDYPLDPGTVEEGTNGMNMTFSRLILFDNASNSGIIGRGVIDGDGYALRQNGRNANLIRTRSSDNITIKDVILRDSAAWCVHLLYTDYVTIQGIKIIQEIESINNDGVDPDSCEHVLIDDCFMYCTDDTIAIKATENSGLLKNVDDIRVTNCVFYSEWGGMKVGTETRCDTITNIHFENNHMVRCGRAILVVIRDGATYQYGTYLNNTCDKATDRTILMEIENRSGVGRVKDLEIINFETPVFSINNSDIHGYDSSHLISDVVFRNLKIAGELRLSASEARIDEIYTSNITFVNEGDILKNLTINDSPNKDDWTIQTELEVGDVQYGDRDYTIVSLPSLVQGHEWIRPANDSKSYSGSTLCSFDVAKNAYIYVAHNDNITTKPSWLSSSNGWTDTGLDLTNSEPNTYSLFEKQFSAGSGVSLGENGGSSSGIYMVIAVPEDEAGEPDTTAPAAVSDLAAANPTSSSVDLSWTAPGDDGSTGTASSYDIRYSTSSIDDANWDSATQVSGEPTPSAAGSSESVTVSGLNASTTYYFAIKTSDEAGNESAISNSPSEMTGAPDTTAPAAINDLAASNATAVSVDLTWTATGDDGSTGTAASYDVRYSTSPIDAANFDSATEATGEPTPAASGASESMTVSGLLSDTTYYFAIKAIDEAGNASGVSNSPSATTLSAPPIDVAINFEPAGSTTPSGYIADVGEAYGSRNGYTYGWSAGNTGETRDRNNHSDQRYDTLCHFSGLVWEMEVASGSYDIMMVCGDPSFSDQINTLDVEGTIVTDPDGQDNFDEYTLTVSVTDGRLTIGAAAGGNNPKICFIEITAAGAADTTAPAAINDLSAGSATTNSIDLAWTAPGDDGSTGTASSYDIRYSTSAIDETNWDSSSQVTGEPAPQAAGSAESVTVAGLADDTTSYFAIKTADEAGNVSAISNSPSGTTLIETDTTAPAAITDLATSNATSSSIDLSWTATGDDGATGTASSYDIRYSTSAISEANWSSATQVSGEPAPQAAGSSEAVTVSGLSPDTTYYFAIKAADDAGNISGVSNSPSGTTTSGGSTDPLSITNLSASSGRTYSVQYDALGVNTGDAYTDRNYDFAQVPSSLVGETYIRTANDDKNNTTLSISFDINQECTVYVAHDDRVTAKPSWLSTWTDTGDDLIVDDDFSNPMSLHSKVFAAGTVTLSQNTNDGSASQIAMYNIVVVPTGGGTPSDTTAPAAISDLSAGSATTDSLTLNWTAPGDDGSTGTASSYDIRYSTSSIDETNWSSATQVSGEPAPQAAGSAESVTVSGLSSDTTYYFAIKTSDEAGNVSAISNSPSGTTLAEVDTTAPAAITDLATSNATSSSIDLSWTATGDDGSTGTASSYDVRYSTSPIDGTNFDSASQATGEPTPAASGSSESFTVTGLSADTTYYFAIKVSDEAGNVSTVSNSPSATTQTGGGGGPLSITNLSSNTGETYTVQYDALFANAGDVFTDRDYVFSTVPTSLTGETYIQTANDDKSSTTLQVTFDINQECTVYVAHDDRFSSVPSWMSTWTNSGMSVVVSDGDSTGATLYSKVFSAGTVTLYENTVGGQGNNMYSIIVVPTGG